MVMKLLIGIGNILIHVDTFDALLQLNPGLYCQVRATTHHQPHVSMKMHITYICIDIV